MKRKFQNPQGTFTQEVGRSSNVGVFFFGGLALGYFGLWGHFAIWVLAVVGAFAIHPVIGVIVWLIAAIYYTANAATLRAEKLLRDGWREVTDGIPAQENNNDQVKASNPGQDLNTKKCPLCAEDVKSEAIKCKHCGADLPPLQAA